MSVNDLADPPAPANRRPHGRLAVRTAFIACTLVYILVLQWAYASVIAPIWEYGGYAFRAPPRAYWVGFSGAALLPSFWIPVDLSRPSQWLYLYLYIAAFIPTCFVPLFREGAGGHTPADLVPLVLTLVVCMAMLGAVYRLPLFRVPRVRLPASLYWLSVMAVALAAYAIVYSVFGASLQLTTGREVLTQRLLGRETFAATGNHALLGYAMNWPPYAIHPLLLAVGLWWRKPQAFALGVAGQVFVYSVNAVRGALATIPLAILLWLTTRQRRVPFAVVWMGFFAALVLAVVAISSVGSRPIQIGASWILLRTIVGVGYITGVYYSFFASHPQTLFSHIRGLGWLGHNPYGSTSLGFVIGESLGSPENNANANLWADGYASYGLLGMLFVTALAAVVFYVIDSSLRRVDTRFATTAVGVQALNLVDLPIFTSVIGGGLGLLVWLVYLLPSASDAEAPTPSPATRTPPTIPLLAPASSNAPGP